MTATPRTALFSRKQSGGMYDITNLEKHPGDVFFVHSVTGSDAAGWGFNPDSPVATVDYAINMCTASKGDVIYVMPGHVESFTATAGFDADVIGISIIGLGNGALRPTFTFADTDAQVNVGAASVTFENLRFIAGIHAIVSAVLVEAKTDFTCRNCEWDYSGTNTHDFIIMLELQAASHNATIENCRFWTEPATAGAASAIQLTAGLSHHVTIADNDFFGDWSTTCVNAPTAVCQDLKVLRNTVQNTNSGETYLEAFNGTTGLSAFNVGLCVAAATIADAMVSNTMVSIENYVANTVGTIAIQRGAGGIALDADGA